MTTAISGGINDKIKEITQQTLKQIKEGKSVDGLSKEEQKNIEALLKLLQGGIEPDELDSVLKLLGSIGHLLDDGMLDKIMKSVKETITQVTSKQLKDIPDEFKMELTTQIVQSLMDAILNKGMESAGF